MIKELVKMANHLDDLGHRDLSDSIDDIISKLALEEDDPAAETDEGSAPLTMDRYRAVAEGASAAETAAVAEGAPAAETAAVTEGTDEGTGAAVAVGTDDEWSEEVSEFDAAMENVTSSKGEGLIEKRASRVNDLSKLFIDESSFYSRS